MSGNFFLIGSVVDLQVATSPRLRRKMPLAEAFRAAMDAIEKFTPLPRMCCEFYWYLASLRSISLEAKSNRVWKTN